MVVCVLRERFLVIIGELVVLDLWVKHQLGEVGLIEHF